MFDEFAPWTNAAAFAAAAGVVWFAGARLAGYADRIAIKTGLGQALLGILLLGGVTSLPELAVGVSATLSGAPLLSVNDILGSAAINLVILAIADAIHGREALTSTPGTPDVLLQGGLGIVLFSLVVAAITAGDMLVFGMGAWSWLLLAAFMGAIWIISMSRGRNTWLPSGPESKAARHGEERDQAPGDEMSMRSLLLRTTAVGLAILVAGYVLARSGEALAEQTGLGTSFFGAVLLGASTSLPELSTVLAAVRLKRHEMALADVLGTNLFNVIVIVIVDALHEGDPILAQAGSFAAFGALLAIALTSLFLVGMIERGNRTAFRMGFDSLLALGTYSGGLAVLYQLR